MAGRGDYDTLIEFQRQTTVKSPLGPEKPGGWAPITQAFAKVMFGTGQERRDGASQGAAQVATFRVLSTAKTRAVTVKDCRIMWGSQAWNITGWANFKRKDIDFTAVAVRG